MMIWKMIGKRKPKMGYPMTYRFSLRCPRASDMAAVFETPSPGQGRTECCAPEALRLGGNIGYLGAVM